MKTLRSGLLALSIGVAVVHTPAHAASIDGPSPGEAATVLAVTSSYAEALPALLLQPGFGEPLYHALAGSREGTVSMDDVLARVDPQARRASSELTRQANARIRALKGLPEQGPALLRGRLVLPPGTVLGEFGAHELRIAATPVGDDRAWTSVRTWGADGTEQWVDADAALAFPLVMIEVDVRTALKEGLQLVNAGLRAVGLQTAPSIGEPLDVTRLDRIRLAVDQEPSLKGAAEIFAISSGLQIDEKKPEMRTFEMPWLEYDKQDYYPGQDWIHWGNLRYDVANVQLFEEDGNTNYKAMLEALLKVVGTTIGPFEPTVGMVSMIADRILQVLPDAWFTDDHDYVDSYYLIQRNKRYSGWSGAGANAVVDLEPVTVGRH